jgi:hypothetical protein
MINPFVLWSIYFGVYMHEVVVRMEYSCRYGHGDCSASIIALQECSGLTIPLPPWPPPCIVMLTVFRVLHVWWSGWFCSTRENAYRLMENGSTSYVPEECFLNRQVPLVVEISWSLILSSANGNTHQNLDLLGSLWGMASLQSVAIILAYAH